MPNPFAVKVSPTQTPPEGNPFSAQKPQKPKKQTEQAAPLALPQQPMELPPGAVGRDPTSGQPIFDNSIAGILKKWHWNFTKDVQEVDESEWDDLKARWKQSVEAEGLGGTYLNATLAPLKAITGNVTGFSDKDLEQLSTAGEAVSKGYQDITASNQGSIFAPILKGVGATVTTLGDLFSLGGQKTEQAGGAYLGFREAASELDSLLPRLRGDEFGLALQAMPPLSIAYDAARIALSPSDNKWEYAAQKIEEGWQSGRILYSQVLDPMLKEEFLRRYRSGEDPALLAHELQNPMAELVGQLVLDPLNLVGAFGKATKTAKQLDAARDSLTASNILKTEAGLEAWRVVQAAEDEGTAIRALDALTNARLEANAAALGKSKLLGVRYGITDLTTTSRINGAITKGKTLLGNMALALKESGMSYDAIGEAVLHGAKSVSESADVVREGLAGLSHLPNANIWLSDDYVDAFTLVRRLLEGESGVLDGSRLAKLMRVSDPAEFAEQATKLMAAAAASNFPDVSELGKAAKLAAEADRTGAQVGKRTRELARVFEKLPNHVKYLNKIDSALSKVKNPINKVLSPLYFNLQGGVAVKNVVSNNELILLDMGPSAWLKDGKYWSKASKVDFLKDAFGDLPESAHGFKSLVGAMTDRPAWGFGKLMEKGEESGAVTVVAASVRDTFKKMIPAALPDLSKEIEAGVLTQQQVDKYAALLLKNNGDVKRTEKAWREFYKTGAVEAWRNLNYVSDFERDGLEGLGYWDEIEDLAARGTNSTDEVEQVFEKLNKSIDSRSELATRDVIGLSLDHPAAETWGDLMKAVEEGHLDPGQQQVFTAIMEGAEQARLEYQTLLDDVALKAMNALGQEGKTVEAQRVGQEMNRVREVLRKAAPATARETRTITADAWRWNDAIKAEKNPTPEFLKSTWSRAGLMGEPPLDLNKQSLLKELWGQRFAKVTETWNASFDAIVGESETVLKQMGSVVDATELKSMAVRTRHLTQQAQALRSGVFEKGLIRIRPGADVAYTAKQYGVKPEEILQAINNKLPAGAQAFAKIEDVPTNEVMNVLEQLRQEKGLPPAAGIAVPPPHPLGSQPSLPRAWNESARGAKYTLDRIKNNILELWGQTDEAMTASPELERALARIQTEVTPKMAEMKAIALRIAEENRNFTLLNYGAKTYGDVALSYVMPYHFYYTHSYPNWISRVATHPEILAGYGKYKRALEEINKDVPAWYKQQIDVTKLLGIQTDHPFFLNLEATFNPLYGLTGTDFYDPAKRTNAVTASIDDMGKFGPSMWAPIQMAIAAKLFMDGEADAASRWGSRLIPETAQVKAVTSLFGKPVELDPAVNFFSGGIDSTERGRMGYAAAQLIREGRYTAEELQEQFQAQEGPAWDEAYRLAIQSRAASSISSYFLGVGFKPRSTNDVTIEQMYTDLNELWAMSDTLTSEQFKEQYEQIRSSYPPGMMDTVLLAKKGGDKRDAAYTYSVLGRLPPGEMGDVFKAIGSSNDDISKFYASKGFTDPKVKFTKGEKEDFMRAVVNIATMLAIPEDATRQEWDDARSGYKDAMEDVSNRLGMPYEKDARGKVLKSGVWDMVSHYYDLRDDDKDAADQFKAQHPEVQAALQMKGEAIASSPLLSAYYGGIDNLEAYLSGAVRQELETRYGRDIYAIQTAYYDATNQRGYLSQHPELRRFWTDKAKLDKENEKAFMEFGSKLTNPKGAQFREGFVPQSGVQETMFEELRPQETIPPWSSVSQGMPQWLQQEIASYAYDGRKISTRAQKELDYLAKGAGYYDYKDMLRTASLSLRYGAQQPQAAANPFANTGQP